MVKKNGLACPCSPDEPKVVAAPITPIVSVKSINGMVGDVTLKSLTIGDKTFNGSDDKTVYANDIKKSEDSTSGLKKAFVYDREGTTAQLETWKETAETGDVFFCTTDNLFYLSVGEGGTKQFLAAVGLEDYAKKTWVQEQGYLTAADISGKADITYVDTKLATKQDVLTAGSNITISGNTISATDTTYTAGTNVSINGTVITAVDTKYTAGTNVSIDGTVINATDTTYTAGENITITNNVISAKAGAGLEGVYYGTTFAPSAHGLAGLTRDFEITDFDEMKASSYIQYFYCYVSQHVVRAYPKGLGNLAHIYANDQAFDLLSTFTLTTYTAKDGTEFNVYFQQGEQGFDDHMKYEFKWQ